MGVEAGVYCYADGCDVTDEHATRNHVCGTCGRFGHGSVEHDDVVALDVISQAWLMKLPDDMWCSVAGCHSPAYHSRHYCFVCHEYASHAPAACPNLDESVYSSELGTGTLAGVDTHALTPQRIKDIISEIRAHRFWEVVDESGVL